MTYNLHPIFVHFPIAFLLLYSVIKIIPFRKLFPKVSWKQTELLLLVVGILGAYLAAYTGEIAEKLVGPNKQLVNMHSNFASISIWTYSAILVGELLYFILPIISVKYNIQDKRERVLGKLFKFLERVKNALTDNAVQTMLSIVGFVAISITGLLGGVMVYGLSADPIAGIVLKMLGIDY